MKKASRLPTWAACIALLCCAGAYAATPLATSWEVAGEFNTNVNTPNSLWQYGWKSASSPDGTFTRFAFKTLPPLDTPNMVGWKISAGSNVYPFVMQNQKVLPTSPGGPGGVNLVPARGVVFHPSPSEIAVIRFTAPTAALYRISGQFYAGDAAGGVGSNVGTNSIAYVVTDGPPVLPPPIIWSAPIQWQATTPYASFTSLSVMLDVGQHVDFQVGPGANSNSYDSTGLKAVIEQVGPYCPPLSPPCQAD